MALLIPSLSPASQERNFTGRPAVAGYGQLLTAHATPHTLGTKVEIIAATAYDASWVSVVFADMFSSGANSDGLANLYIGGSGSELPLIPNMMCGWVRNVDAAQRRYRFPIFVPRGSRLSMDLQALITLDTVRVTVELFGGEMQWRGVGVETLGALTATSRGTDVTPGAASEGTFTTIGTSSRRYRYVQAQMSGNSDVTVSASLQALDVGISGVLVPELADFWANYANNEAVNPGLESAEGRFCDIVSGAAIEARLQSQPSDTEAKSVCVYGVY